MPLYLWTLQRYTNPILLLFIIIYLHMTQKAHMACNFDHLTETEGLLKVTGEQMHCKSGNILEWCKMFYYKTFFTRDH